MIMNLDTLLSSPIIAATIGGAIIGLASGGYYLLKGRIIGISGILADSFIKRDQLWRMAFVFGLVASGIFIANTTKFDISGISENPIALVVSGLLVGIGTRIGNGCTSGHGVCGLSRFSLRSLIAVGVFMAFAALTVFLIRISGIF